MKCEKTKSLLLAYITDNLNKKQYKEVKNHLNLCNGCYVEYKEYENLWRTLDKLTEKQPQFEIKEQIFRTIHNEMAKENQKRKLNFLPLLFLSILCGIILTVAGFLIISFKVNFKDFALSGILLFALLWAVSFSTMVLFIIRQTFQRGIDFSSISKVVLFSFVTRILLDYVCPMSFAIKVFGIKEMTTPICFLFGTIYSLLPLLVITFKFRELGLFRPSWCILLTSLLFITVILPYNYITGDINQFLILVTSTTVGALIGSASGYILKTRFSLRYG